MATEVFLTVTSQVETMKANRSDKQTWLPHFPESFTGLPSTLLIITITWQCLVTPQVKAQTCIDGSITFEKTSGYDLNRQHAQARVLKSQAGQAVLPDCIELCRRNDDCHVFNIEYALGICTSISVNESRRELLRINPSASVFEKLCLNRVRDYEGVCEHRMWAFERVVGASMIGFQDREESNVQSRAACEALCLIEKTFTCRSAQYDSDTRTCILSREDRRSQPSAFRHTGLNVDYLENQCVTPPISSCVYGNREHVTLVSIEDLRASYSRDECQTDCDHSRLFFCRSYTFIPNQRICYLSGDDTVSLSNVTPRTGAIYGERKCTGNQCSDGIVTFEKVTGYELRHARQEDLSTQALGATARCLSSCKQQGATCPAVVINYATSVCHRLDRSSQFRDDDLVPAPVGGLTYFEPVCLRGNTQSCTSKLWAFERVPNHELRGFDDSVVLYVQSRRECEEACIQVRTFQCRSAEYDYDNIQCTLSSEDRRSQRPYFVSTPNRIDYLENQCLRDRLDMCNYAMVDEGIARYVDVIVSNIESVDGCREACDLEVSFNCRSFSFREESNECLLSGDDEISGGKIAVVPSSGISYYERVCRSSDISNDTDDTTTTTKEWETTETSPETVTVLSSSSFPSAVTPTLPFPFSPPTQEPFTTVPEPTSSTDGRCRDDQGRTEFQRTTGYKVADELSLLHDGGNILGITYECTVKCNADATCQGFVLDYVNNKCYSVRNDPKSNSLQRAPSTSYHEPVCYQVASGCGKLWTFERFPKKQLNIAATVTLRDVTKAECQERCLTEMTFICRSINFDASQQDCRLNSDDRTTRPTNFMDSSSYDYMENQCHQFPFLGHHPAVDDDSADPKTPMTHATKSYYGGTHPRTSKGTGRGPSREECLFANDESNTFLTYVEKEKLVSSETECQRTCQAEVQFNCRSFTYINHRRSGYQHGHCYINAETRESLGAEMRTQVGASYVERVCREHLEPLARPPPPPPYFPPYPAPPLLPQPYYPTFRPFPVYPLAPPALVPPPQYHHPYQPVVLPGRPQSPPFNTPHPDVESIHPTHPSKEPLHYLNVLPAPYKCLSNLDVTFERVTQLASRDVGSEVRISLLLSPTLDCIRECVAFGSQCQAITYRTSFHGYSAPCTVHGSVPSVVAATATTSAITSPDAAYFQKICVSGQKCGKAWTFDRVPFHILEGHDDLELRNINTRDECAAACLHQTAFPCRSAEYYSSQSLCRLSQETRRTQPLSYRYYGDGGDYMENHCNPDSGFCDFIDFAHKFLPYFDRRLLEVHTLHECKLACLQENDFVCHSVSHDDQSKECYLSSCDRFCGYGTVERSSSVYSERQACNANNNNNNEQDFTATIFRKHLPPRQPLDAFVGSSSHNAAMQSHRHQSFNECAIPLRLSYERTTGYTPPPSHQHQDLMLKSTVRGITEECVRYCSELGSRCQAFVLVYLRAPSTPECVVYNHVHSGGSSEATPEQSNDAVYFEKLCLGGQPCDKLWAFERMFGYEMASNYGISLEEIKSRQECEHRCAQHVQFQCRSAIYITRTQTCRLHTQSRHTRPKDFRRVAIEVQYLENQCAL